MAVEMVPIVPELEGNTKSSNSAGSPALYWCFTHNFEDLKIDKSQVIEYVCSKKIEEKLSLICKNYFFALEVGEDKKRKHLQGYIHLKKKLRLKQCKKIIDDTTHWEKCKGNYTDNVLYCYKAPLHLWEMKNKIEYTPQQLKIIPYDRLYDFQRDIINIVESEPDRRTVHWFWSCCGCLGKSTIIQYCLYNHNCGLIGGNKADIMFNIVGKKGDKPIKKCYFMNLEKNVNVNAISYSAIEQIKDGLIISTKYESDYKLIPPVHIIIFANKPPNTTKLMDDRWKITKICYCPEYQDYRTYLPDSDSDDD